jgi:spermidine synthase
MPGFRAGSDEMLASGGRSADTRRSMKRERLHHRSKTKPRKTAPAAPGVAAGKAERRARDDKQGWMLWSMIGLSGFACLVYQILWMRQLGLLFGNTSHAAALTLAVFFGGLAAGSWFWGRRCRHLANPLRTYGWLELGIAACGVAVFAAPGVIHHFHPMIYQRHGTGMALVAFKLMWTLLMVFPSAALMGGTLPVIGQAVIRHTTAFGTTTARLYAVNTIGAACGAFATAFVFISILGIRLTCGVAMAASVVAGWLAFRLSRQAMDFQTTAGIVEKPAVRQTRKPNQPHDGAPGLSRPAIRLLALVSGFSLLALEVIWTRMLAQVHENSVYGFSAVLIVVLACLALGAWLAARLARGKSPAPQVLVLLIVLGGTALCITPFIFTGLTRGMSMLATDRSFAGYVMLLFGTAFAAIGPACLLLGAVFPFLMKAEERFTTAPGDSIGTLSAINTLGAILGSLAAGFLLLEWLGLWRSIQCIAAGYLLVALLIPCAKAETSRAFKAMACVMLLLSFTVLSPARLPASWTKDHLGVRETLVEKWEASDCTVTVVRDSQDHLAIKINSNYSLGSTAAIAPQIFQARIPLLAFPGTDSVFFLGMGTGITAGEALDRDSFPNIAEVVACELSPSVVAAAEKYFAGGAGGPDLTHGLFQDPRARILVEDGRKHLMATGAKYSMINADLFLPYRRGTGNLYSREHFQNARKRLMPGGVFVQWLPLYQISEREFGIIARTMNAVFPHVSLWRGNFQPGAEIAALVGHADGTPVPASGLDMERDKQAAVEGATHLDMHNLMLPINEQTVLLFYAGNVGLAADFFEGYPLNTDDRPVIEFGTPRSLHRPADEGKPQFLQDRFADLVDRLLERTPPEDDPLLAARTPSSRQLPLAGSAFHRGSISSISGNDETWRLHWDSFLKHWTGPSPVPGGP